eukprot:47012-Chlamydomonas_euryale.AAC.1
MRERCACMLRRSYPSWQRHDEVRDPGSVEVWAGGGAVVASPHRANSFANNAQLLVHRCGAMN